MQIPRTYLVLILGSLLIGACSPPATAKQASSPIVAAMGGVIQPFSATPTPVTGPSGPGVSSSTVLSLSPTESQAFQADESDREINPETSFPLAPNTQFDPGNGGSEEAESSGAFLLHSQAPLQTVDQFYQSTLPSQGWKLRYIDANHGGGMTQYWKQGTVFMSLDFAYDNTGLAIQVQWHKLDVEYSQLLPKVIPLPHQAELVDATDTTWQVYIPQDFKSTAEYFQQKAAALKWKPGIAPGIIDASCGDCVDQVAPTYPPDGTPMPTTTPDPRQPQALFYTMTDGNEISLVLHPHQSSTILDITLTLKNVESAGLPKELQIYPGATGMEIAPGMLRFTVPIDLKTIVDYYIDVMTHAGWNAFAGYSLDTPQLYFQEWDKGDDAVRFNISSTASSPHSSTVSIQCLQCTAP